VPDELRGDPLAAIARIGESAERHELLSSAAKLGVDLLTLPLEAGDRPD
jgi:hypothetical protein